MKGRSITLLILACLIAVCSFAQAAQTVKGTVVSSLGACVSILPDGATKSITIKPGANTVITRGQIGVSERKATLIDLAPGDRVVAVVNQDGTAASVKAYYAVAKGTLSMRESKRLFFRDGRFVKLAPGVRVVLANGKVGKIEDIKVNSPLICRLNPSTQEAWMIVASEPVQPKPVAATKPAGATTRVAGFSEIAVAPVFPTKARGVLPDPAVQPIIESVTYVAPENLKARDWMRIDLTGTPGGRAICEVKGLIPRTVMEEKEPGKYRASVMVPSGKFVRNEPVLGHLTINGVDAPTVQAAKLITVEEPLPELPKLPEPVVAVAPPPAPQPAPEPAQAVEPAPQPVVEQSKPEPPKEKAPVILTAPVMGSRILRTLLVTGTAEPGSNVMVTVTYSNGLGGLLNLSGQVSSQLIAANESGQFQMGPLPLEGPLATKGLIFTVKASYPESPQSASVVSVFGDRS